MYQLNERLKSKMGAESVCTVWSVMAEQAGHGSYSQWQNENTRILQIILVCCWLPCVQRCGVVQLGHLVERHSMAIKCNERLWAHRINGK